MVPVLTTLAEVLRPPRCALLVIDMQNDFIHPEGWSGRRDGRTVGLRRIIPPTNRLIAGARDANVPVVYLRMEHGPEVDAPNYQARYALRGIDEEMLCATGTLGAALDADLLPPQAEELELVRHSYDAFVGTSLDVLLRHRGVETVVGIGAVTNLCVQTTLQHAFALGYYIVVVEDATAAIEPMVQDITLDNFRRFFGHVASAETVLTHWRRQG